MKILLIDGAGGGIQYYYASLFPSPTQSAELSGELNLHTYMAAMRVNEAVQSRAALNSSALLSTFSPPTFHPPPVFSSEEPGEQPVPGI